MGSSCIRPSPPTWQLMARVTHGHSLVLWTSFGSGPQSRWITVNLCPPLDPGLCWKRSGKSCILPVLGCCGSNVHLPSGNPSGSFPAHGAGSGWTHPPPKKNMGRRKRWLILLNTIPLYVIHAYYCLFIKIYQGCHLLMAINWCYLSCSDTLMCETQPNRVPNPVGNASNAGLLPTQWKNWIKKVVTWQCSLPSTYYLASMAWGNRQWYSQLREGERKDEHPVILWPELVNIYEHIIYLIVWYRWLDLSPPRQQATSWPLLL